MKKNLGKAALSLILLAVLPFVFGACEITTIEYYDVNGKTVNARAAKSSTEWWKSGTETLQGATITFTNLSTAKTRTATVGADGTYKLYDVEAGEYKITGSKTGWSFVPRDVELTGDGTMPDLLAYMLGSAETDAVLIITEWKNRSIDVDSVLVIDDQDQDALDPANAATSNILATVGYTGYSGGAGAAVTSFGGTPAKAALERDITEVELGSTTTFYPAVETILIYSNPFSGTNNTGWLRFYLSAFNTAAGDLTGNSYASPSVKRAEPTVHVMQGAEHLGTFKLPVETQEQTVGILKIKVTPVSGGTSYAIMSFGNLGGETFKSLGNN